MPKESFVPYQDTVLFNLSRITQKEVLLVFFHGIGDSHLNYQCFFETPILDPFDLLITDLLGHGRSGDANTYSFSAQIDAIKTQLKPLIGLYEKIIFIPHSMGGIHATLLANDIFPHQISGIYAIETSVTQYGSFVSEKVSHNEKNGLSFNTWFNQFCDDIYLNKGIKNSIFRRYFAGLQFVRKEAFLQNALEMHKLSVSLKEKTFTHAIGDLFVSLPIPIVYCFGTTTPNETISFLYQKGIKTEYFDTNCHWIAQTFLEDFCKKLVQFIREDALIIKLPPEKMKSALIYYACLFQLGLMNRPHLKKLLALLHLLTKEGVYYDIFLELIYDSEDKTIGELGLFYKQALDTMKIPVPTEIEDTMYQVIWYHLNKIIHEQASPISEIGTLYNNFVQDHEHESFPAPLRELFECYYFEVNILSDNEYEHKSMKDWEETNQHLLEVTHKSFQFLEGVIKTLGPNHE